MSCKSPPTLEELAEYSLLRNPAVAIAAMDALPSYFFPSLFKKACRRRYASIVIAMVQAWPFPCLPLGAMIKRKSSYRRILEMILSGIDGLLFQKVDHSRCKLKVLDLRAVSLKMWNRWPVFKTSVWSENLAGENPSGTEMKPLVKVVTDLVLRRNPLDSVEAFLVHWVRGREGLMSLCCDKLQIWSMSISHHGEMLNMLDLGSVQELKLFYMDNPTCLLHFSPYLGRMRRLRSLLLCYLWSSFFITPVEKQQVITQFTSQFVKLKHLRSLRLHNTYFLKGHLDELFWWLKAPLESLLVTDCYLSKSDWVHMCEFLCTSQLKHLVVKYVKLTHFSPEPLRALLLKSASTLVTLELEGCQLVDSQIKSILPALRYCTKLTRLNIQGNYLSSNDLEGVEIPRSD